MNTTAQHYTEAQATDEALLLFVRKVRRLHRDAFADVWSKLPDGAKYALEAAERRADVLRDDSAGLTWAPCLDDDGEE